MTLNQPQILTRMTAEDSFNSDIQTVVVGRPEYVLKVLITKPFLGVDHFLLIPPIV